MLTLDIQSCAEAQDIFDATSCAWGASVKKVVKRDHIMLRVGCVGQPVLDILAVSSFHVAPGDESNIQMRGYMPVSVHKTLTVTRKSQFPIKLASPAGAHAVFPRHKHPLAKVVCVQAVVSVSLDKLRSGLLDDPICKTIRETARNVGGSLVAAALAVVHYLDNLQLWHHPPDAISSLAALDVPATGRVDATAQVIK
jgi:hypothetical protein